jgi:ribose 1,5-bisphosphokinase PhnN
MSQRKLKEIRKGYRQAGAIYWTKDMEVIIRRIRSRRTEHRRPIIQLRPGRRALSPLPQRGRHGRVSDELLYLPRAHR